MKGFGRKLAVLVVVAFGLSILLTNSAKAFNGNNLMDDFVFDNSGSMSSAQIDSWLNANFPSSCISINHGFSAPDPTGYSPSTGFTYGGNVSAGRVIYDAAQAYGINPQVLLTTLQKEQSIVSGAGGCSTLAYTGAMGYGCPDGGTTYSYSGVNLYSINGTAVTSVSGTCVNSSSKAGFSQQIIHGAWLLKFGEQRSEGNTGWAVIKGSWDNSDDPPTCYGGPMTQGNFKRCSSDSSTVFFDGNITIDSTTTHMDTGPTAALYWYTPHFNGNQNFDNIFTAWFGNIYANYSWATSGYSVLNSTESNFVDAGRLNPGQQYIVKLQATNVGDATWTSSSPTPVTLATTNPQGHNSFLCDPSWILCSRPTYLQESGSIAPGQGGNFRFMIKAPYQPGAYHESFKPVAEFLRWFNDVNNETLNIYVTDPGIYKWATSGYRILDQTESVYEDSGNLQPNTKYVVKLEATNIGTATWTSSSPTPVTLATTSPQGHGSYLCDPSWLACSRPTYLQDSGPIAPGQVGNFRFMITTPSTPGTYHEYFKPVSEFESWFNDVYDSLGFTVK